MSEEAKTEKPPEPKVYDDKKRVAVQITEAQGMMISQFLGGVRTSINDSSDKVVRGAYDNIVSVFGEPPKIVRRQRPPIAR